MPNDDSCGIQQLITKSKIKWKKYIITSELNSCLNVYPTKKLFCVIITFPKFVFISTLFMKLHMSFWVLLNFVISILLNFGKVN